MAMQTITKGRHTSRPHFPLAERPVVTAKGAGYCDAMRGVPARPAPYGRRAGQYMQGYRAGLRDTWG